MYLLFDTNLLKNKNYGKKETPSWASLQGRIGDMLFKVRKGQQISGKLQKQVINTRTSAQMKQRTQLNNLVACYRVLKPAIEMDLRIKHQIKVITMRSLAKT